MTISSTVRKAGPFAGNGVTTVFTFNFKVFVASEVVVTLLVIATGVETVLTLTTDYTIALNADQDDNPGGTVTYNPSGTPMASTHTLTVTSDVEQTQEIELPNGGGWYPEVVEKALDRVTILVQQLSETLSRAFLLPQSSSASAVLPSAVAGTAFGWNGTGTAIVNYVLQAGTSLVDILASLAVSGGSALIGFIQSGAGAVARTLQSKLREYPSVTDYGAVGDGTTDETAAFTAAQTAHAYVYVPQGLTFKVDPGLNYWQFFGNGTVVEPGITWDLSPVPQDDYTTLKAYKKYTWGTFEHAAAASITAASAINTCLRSAPAGTSQAQENTQVLGTSGAGLRATVERPSVALNTSIATRAQYALAATTYTATTVQDAAVAALISAGKLKRGMIIDVAQAADRLTSTHTGTIQSWAGTTITVDAWYTTSGGAVSTPANGTACVVNPVNKIWNQNANVYVQEDNIASTGYELGIIAASDARAQKAWGFDVVSLSGTKVLAPFIQRGKASYSFLSMNYTALGHPEIGFCSEAPTLHGFHVRNPGASAYSFSVVTGATADTVGNLTVGGALKWAVQQDGLVGNDFRMIHQDTDLAGVSAGGVISSIANVIVNVTLNRALVLPTAVGIGGRVYTVLGYQQCSLAAAGGQTLDATTAAIVIGPRGRMQVISDGANWLILSQSHARTANVYSISAAPYTVTDRDQYLFYNGASGGTVTLPTPVGALGRVVSIRGTTQDFVLACALAGTQIDDGAGGLVATLAIALRQTVTVISDGTVWRLVHDVA